MEKSQVQELQRRPKGPEHEPLSSLKRPSSYYEEVIDSSEKWLNEDDPGRKGAKGNQIDACKIHPVVLTEQGHENKEDHVTKVLDVPNFHMSIFRIKKEVVCRTHHHQHHILPRSNVKSEREERRGLKHLMAGNSLIFE